MGYITYRPCLLETQDPPADNVEAWLHDVLRWDICLQVHLVHTEISPLRGGDEVSSRAGRLRFFSFMAQEKFHFYHFRSVIFARSGLFL